MATLIKVWVDSSLVSKCDGDCYNATDSDCDCCCGGVNHGVGLFLATQNTRSISLGSIIDWIEAHAEFKQSVTIIITPRHWAADAASSTGSQRRRLQEGL